MNADGTMSSMTPEPQGGTELQAISPGAMRESQRLAATEAPRADIRWLLRALPLPLLAIMLGSSLQGYVNGTIDVVALAVVFFVFGCVVAGLSFSRRRQELRVFFLSYGLCVLAGGLAQYYTFVTFGEVQTYPDAHKFFAEIAAVPPFTRMQDISPSFNAPLAVVIWQQVYKFTWWFGFQHGPYTGILFNALVVACTGSLTVRTAREALGNDEWRLRRVATLYALCGLFILLGAVLLRDAFTTFFNALVLWGIVRWLSAPSLRNFALATVLTALSMAAIAGLRYESIVLFGAFWFLAFVYWFKGQRLNAPRLVIAVIATFTLLLGSTYLISYIEVTQRFRADTAEGYEHIAADSSQEQSLAMRLIIQQPLPVRLILGSGSLMVFPIPLWGYLRPDAEEYHLIKTYHGIYQIVVLPLVFAAYLQLYLLRRRDCASRTPLAFLGMYLILTSAAVVATSLEQRHLAQFMPAFMILAAIPDTRVPKTAKLVKELALTWFIVVIGIHILWFLLDAVR